MTQKQNCIEQCKDYLKNHSLLQVFSEAEFNSFYRKHNGSNANTFSFGLKAADYLIKQTNFKLINS